MPAKLALWLDVHLCDIQLRTQDKAITLDGGYPVPALWGTERRVDILPTKKTLPFSILQLMMEYYYMPHVHDFVTINIKNERPLVRLNDDRTFELILRFKGSLELTDIAETFLLDCVPVRQLEQMTSAAIPINNGISRYEISLKPTHSGAY
ncbi:type VI secretion system baseplate subunit TssF [Photorhabdus thracensis]|uniref:type VI secretion system baseplate subunit TssF n=1 Tax=Photorhabdus thracensis TaxID=230089 RepID=UPI001E37D469|nr:type VI secretion system baseplate subunit TssF [Photorhabdus thracensis]